MPNTDKSVAVLLTEDMGHGGTLDQRTNLTQILSDWRPVQSIVTSLPLSGSSTPNNDFGTPAFRA